MYALGAPKIANVEKPFGFKLIFEGVKCGKSIPRVQKFVEAMVFGGKSDGIKRAKRRKMGL